MPIKINNLPDNPGIYLFYNKKELIYVGKASSLKNRVRSYFSGKHTPRPIEQMIHQVARIDYKKTDSILEAVLLEGEYIKKYRPKYNIVWKDDKSWNYIVISRDKYPQIKTLRQHERDNLTLAEEKKEYSHIFGPYPGLKTKEVLRILQRLFFISICSPKSKRPCLYNQMGQCLGVCTGEISTKDYKQKVIKHLIMFLRGNKKGVISNLKKQMKEFSDKKEYEEAARLRNQIKALARIYDIALLNKTFVKDKIKSKESFRIEGYDISNLGASHKVGSMVVFDESGPIKRDYRKFNIKGVAGQSDVDCLAEVLERRLKHAEWPMPDMFLVDGGKPQVNTAKKILDKFGIKIPVLGIAKGPKRDKDEFVFGQNQKSFILWVKRYKNILLFARDEAHRFAISFSKSKRKM